MLTPLLVRALGALLAVLVVIGAWWAYRSEVTARQQAEARVDQLNQDLIRVTKNAEVTQAVLTARADSKARIQTNIKEIIREVPVYVPAGTPPLPGGWRVLHDSAAAGVPPGPGGADAAPVAAQEAAETVIDNYGACRDTADQLAKLQQWVRGVSE